MDESEQIGANDFEALRAQWERHQAQQQSLEKCEAPRQNFIRFLTPRYRLARSETGFHTPFLRDLLDPFGTHGQGALFLRGFLSLLAEKKSKCQRCIPPPRDATFELPCIKDFPEPDDWIVGPHAYIDIAVFGRKSSVLLFIENKIEGREQSEQLTRYRTLLDSKTSYRQRLLLFLAPRNWPNDNGGNCPTSGGPDFHINYEDHILGWLRPHIDDERLPLKLRGNLQQYCEEIERLSNGEVTMDNEHLTELLAEPENIRCAISIGNAIDGVRKRLDKAFWDRVRDILGDACACVDGWELSDSRDMENPSRTGVYVMRPHDGLRLLLGVMQEGAEKPFFFGVGFTGAAPQASTLTDLVALQKQLKRTEWNLNDTGGYWLGGFNAEWTNRDDFRVRIARDLESEVRVLTEPISVLLRDHQSLLNAADDALRTL